MWVWNLAALMLRSRKSWLRMVPMAVALLIMTVSLGVNRSINLSPEQSVTSTLGAADGLVSPGFSVLAGSSSPTVPINRWKVRQINPCLLYTSDAADDSLRVDLGGRRIIKKKKK